MCTQFATFYDVLNLMARSARASSREAHTPTQVQQQLLLQAVQAVVQLQNQSQPWFTFSLRLSLASFA